jgi:hypothetical protein
VERFTTIQLPLVKVACHVQSRRTSPSGKAQTSACSHACALLLAALLLAALLLVALPLGKAYEEIKLKEN